MYSLGRVSECWVAAFLAASSALAAPASVPLGIPNLTDARLQIAHYADAPDIVVRTARREQIVRSIVTPSEEIAPQFQGWEVKAKSGEVFTGLQDHWRSGGAASLVLLDGREKTIAAAHVESFRAMETSLMPAGLAALFSVEEFRDLVAYLEQLR